MIRQDANNMSYKDFLDEYVIHPDYWMTFTFTYKGKTYQFDYDVKEHPEVDKIMPYCFVEYGPDVPMYAPPIILSVKWYKSFLDAINNVRIEGKNFEEIYNDPDSEIVDLN